MIAIRPGHAAIQPKAIQVLPKGSVDFSTVRSHALMVGSTSFSLSKFRRGGSDIAISIGELELGKIGMNQSIALVYGGVDYVFSRKTCAELDTVSVAALDLPSDIEPYYHSMNMALERMEAEGFEEDGPIIKRPAITRQVQVDSSDVKCMGDPGYLIEINPGVKTVFIGDLHANAKNLLSAVNAHEKELAEEKVVIVVMGDAIHPQTGNLEEMDSSIEMIRIICDLKAKYGDCFHYILGDHETLEPGFMTKRNIDQPDLFVKAVVRKLGNAYVRKIDALWKGCPYAVLIPGIAFAAHNAVVENLNGIDDIIHAGLPGSERVALTLLSFRPEAVDLKSGNTYPPQASERMKQLLKVKNLISAHTSDPEGKSSIVTFGQMPGHYFLQGWGSPEFLPFQVMEVGEDGNLLPIFISPDGEKSLGQVRNI